MLRLAAEAAVKRALAIAAAGKLRHNVPCLHHGRTGDRPVMRDLKVVVTSVV